MNWKNLLKTDQCRQDTRIHSIALAIAVFGPLLNFWIRPLYASFVVNSYLYWTTALVIYVGLLIPFVLKIPKVRGRLLTLSRLIVLGVTVEDFCSNVWNTILTGERFLPFLNWYTQHFPFLGGLGEPTPILLVPQWYVVAAVAYVVLTFVQYSGRIK